MCIDRHRENCCKLLRLCVCVCKQGDCILARNAANLVEAVRQMFSVAEGMSVAVSCFCRSLCMHMDVCVCGIGMTFLVLKHTPH